MSNRYDYLVIGSGPAGHISAIKAAQLGLNVAVLEKDPEMLGGVCLNEGCIPAKSLLNDAYIFSTLKKSGELYFQAPSAVINMQKLVEKSRSSSDMLRKGLAFLFKKNKITLIEGEAKFIDANTIEISTSSGSVKVVADKVLIASGSEPRELPGIAFGGNVWNSSRAIRAQGVPESILIVGGGAIGCEFASFFNMVGSCVTLLEAEESILPFEDKEISRRMRSIFKKKGVKVLPSSLLKSVSQREDEVEAEIESGEKVEKEKYSVVLVAVGRCPSTGSLGLEKAGVDIDERGFIKVDDSLRTTASNIFAAGDVIATPMLAHSASAEGILSAEAASGKDTEPIDYDCMPNAVYSDIGAASVGMTEEEVKKKGIEYSVGKQFFKANGRAVTSAQTEGFVKVIADVSSRKILGAHILHHDAPEMIHEFVVAKRGGLTVDDISGSIHAHPTLSETIMDACHAVFGKSLHG